MEVAGAPFWWRCGDEPLRASAANTAAFGAAATSAAMNGSSEAPSWALRWVRVTRMVERWREAHHSGRGAPMKWHTLDGGDEELRVLGDGESVDLPPNVAAAKLRLMA